MNVPRLARWLLERTLPYADRAAILGDLAEEFSRRQAAGERASAWYWRQALSALPHGLRKRVPRVDTSLTDARFAMRLWRRHPAFAAAAIATQAVGIAVTTAVLAVAYAVLVRPLPFADPARLVKVLEGERSGQLSFQDFLDVRRSNRSLDAIAAFSGGSRTLAVPAMPPERLPMVGVTEGFFEVLGVSVIAGRTFTTADVHRNSAPVVIVSHEAWTRRFGANPALVGRTILLNGIATEVVGILPRSFSFPPRGRPELWLPLVPTVQQEQRGYMHWMETVARRRQGVSASQLQTDMNSVASVIASRDARNHADVRMRSVPWRDAVVKNVRPTINALLAGVALVLIVTCATTAALLLSRSTPRRGELAVRAALGASRGRIVQQLAVEALMLSLAGGIIGIVAGHWLLKVFVTGMPAQQRASLPHFEDPGVGVAISIAAMTLSLVSGLLFGIVPALSASRSQAGDALKGVRVTSGGAELRLRSALVSIQVAIALVLLAGAGLLASSVHRLLSVPTTADPERLVTMRLNLPPKYDRDGAVLAFDQRLVDELSSIPGVTGAALINQPPLSGGGNNGDLHIAGRPLTNGERAPTVLIRTVSPNYFTVMQVPVLRGRSFSVTDSGDTPQVVTINRVLADSVFAGSDPIGQRISFQFLPGDWEIVGVVGNERFDDVDRPLLPVVYFTMWQGGLGSFTAMLRANDTGAAVAAARSVVSRLDPDLPVFGVRTVDQLASESSAVFLRRATLWMLAVFAAASLLLAAMGLYGVLAQAVADRTREIGVRVALGATRGRIMRLILRDGLRALAVGAVAGIAGALVASRWLSSLVFGVSPRDPLTIAAATLLLLVVALLACGVPTKRALQVDPATAIRDA